jgi:ABC-2 type transport system ATP-binding protein
VKYVLRTSHLSKIFCGKEVISDINMYIQQGEIYGFLGPNGAGKTTVMRLISNLIKPTSGEIEIFGEKLTDTSYEVFKRMGSIIEYPVFYEKLTARENLSLHCEYMGYHDKKAIDRALGLVNLKDIDKKPVKHFSLGMKQRLGIARAVATKPEFLMLDEPINGLDPIGIKELRDLFRMLSKEYGITLFISSHILGEIEQIANTIGVINNGRLIEQISMDRIRDSSKEYIEIETRDCRKAAYTLENKLGITNFKIADDSIIRIYGSEIPQGDIVKAFIHEGIVIDAVNKKVSSLEEYFFNSLNGGAVND